MGHSCAVSYNLGVARWLDYHYYVAIFVVMQARKLRFFEETLHNGIMIETNHCCIELISDVFGCLSHYLMALCQLETMIVSVA